MKIPILMLMLAGVLCLSSAAIQAQNTVSGTVQDAESGDLLVGATILIKGTTTGATTNADGRFSISSGQSFPWTLVVSYVGYTTKEVSVAGPTATLGISIGADITALDNVVVSASRKPEKITESPASVSVLSSKKLETLPSEGETLNMIKNTPGVRLINNGIAKTNVTIRGQALVNETLTLVLKDYRPLNNAHTTIIDNERMGVNPLDIDKIEVIRGPSGALWGAGVNAGVVHFITKDPFKYPGTSVSVNQSVEGQGVTKFNFRHAASSKKFGYKILYAHRSGDDFVYDLQNQDDIAAARSLISTAGPPPLRDGIIQGVTGGPDIPLPIETDANGDQTYNLIPEFHSNTIEASFEFRPTDDLKIAIAPQWGESLINFRNAGGHTRDWGNILNVQGRVNYKDFFASINYFEAYEWNGKNGSTTNGNRSTALITTGTDNRGNIQVYDLVSQMPFFLGDKWDFVTGVDAKLLRYRGSPEGIPELPSRHGRHEEDDDFDVIGGYLQATYKPTDNLKLNAVGRVDHFSIYGSAFSPRLGIVVNPGGDKDKAIRIGLSRAYRAPSPIITNFDYALAGQNVLGARTQLTWNNTLIDYDGLALDANTTTPSLQSIVATLLPYLSTADSTELANTTVSGNASSTLTDPLTGVTFNQLSDQFIRKAVLESTDAIEIGFTGTSANKMFKYTIDGFYQVQQNMLVNFTPVGPEVGFNNIATELTTALQNAGTDPDVIERAVAAATNSEGTGVYDNTAFNALADQHANLGVATPFPSSGFRSFDGKAKYFGLEASTEISLANGFTPFINVSWLSDVVFDTEELDDDPASGRVYYLNTSPFRLRFGLNKYPVDDKGFYGSLIARYDAEFDAQDGVWNGEVPSYFMLDASVGYKMDNGLNFSINSTNITDELYRPLPNIPAQRRLIFLNLSYTLDHNLLSRK